MNEVGSWKFLEAGLLLLAGGLFVWWQLRDVSRAQAQTRAEREAAAKRDGKSDAKTDAKSDAKTDDHPGPAP